MKTKSAAYWKKFGIKYRVYEPSMNVLLGEIVLDKSSSDFDIYNSLLKSGLLKSSDYYGDIDKFGSIRLDKEIRVYYRVGSNSNYIISLRVDKA